MTEELKQKAIEWVKHNSDESIHSFIGEQLQKAYIAGATENTADLENQITELKLNCDFILEGKDNEIDELQEQNTNLQTMLKAEREVGCNEDYLKRVTELEKENERLTVSYETLKLHDEEEIGMLKSENAELKEKLNFSTQYYQGEKAKEQLTKAKTYLKYFIEILKKLRANKEPLVIEAEQFLNSEVEK